MRAVHPPRTGLPAPAVERRLPARGLWGRGSRGYLVAILGTIIVSALLTMLDQPVRLVLISPVQQLLVLGCALRWGLGPGLCALLLGAALGQTGFPHPGAPLAAQAPENLVALGGGLIVGGLVAAVAAERRHRSEQLLAVQLELALVQAELTACEGELERRCATDDGGI
jgi:K+-sensing histidine kinase KdpD